MATKIHDDMGQLLPLTGEQIDEFWNGSGDLPLNVLDWTVRGILTTVGTNPQDIADQAWALSEQLSKLSCEVQRAIDSES